MADIDIPSTEVIIHWVGWCYGDNVADEDIEFDPQRVEQFKAWLHQNNAKVWEQGFLAGERDVFQHEFNNDWDEAKCIPNPYLEKKEVA